MGLKATYQRSQLARLEREPPPPLADRADPTFCGQVYERCLVPLKCQCPCPIRGFSSESQGKLVPFFREELGKAYLSRYLVSQFQYSIVSYS